MAVIGSYNAFIFLAKSPGFLPNVIIWFCNKLCALWEEAVFAKKRGNALFCNSHNTKFMPAIKGSIQSRPIEIYILSTLDSAEDMQTFCIGQWPPD